MTTFVFYHADCIDGFTAAWCFHRANQRSCEAPEFTMIPLAYGDWEKTRKHLEFRADDRVIFVDVSIPPIEVNALSYEVAHITILDHHKTALDLYAGATLHLSKIDSHFDLSKSGARLAWEYLFPDESGPIADLVAYVEDRDLWKKKLPDTEEINAYIGAQPFAFGAYDTMHGIMMVEGAHALAPMGAAILQSKRRVVEDVVRRPQDFELLGVNVKAVNYGARHGISEIGHELAKMSRDGAGLVWYYDGDFVQVSLRGHNGRDVSKIATHFGGGGHPAAAGFRVTLERFLTEFCPAERRFIDP